ncbi:MAG: hypothetical protein IJ379_08200 [Lachnospiraceae bacterium]|nr:hypothetical protein [Lachnospiraceae bacterium]
MPEKILELLETSSMTKEQIARKLNISLEELDAVFAYLQQMGFIKATTIQPTGGGCSGSCGGNCGKCGSSCSTTSGSRYTIWELI